MSSVWRQVAGHDALRPKPSLDLMAQLHVDSTQLGLTEDIELRLLDNALRDEGLTLLIGHSGAGKSSQLARLAQRLHQEPHPRLPGVHVLPLFVPVAANRERAVKLSAFGRGVIEEASALLRSELRDEDRRRLEQAAAQSVSVAHTPSTFNASLVAGAPGLQAKLGADLGHDVITVLTQPDLAAGGLPELARTVSAHGLKLVLIVEDTDAWAEMPDGSDRALGFFTEVLRPLCSDTELVVVTAIQEHWLQEPETSEALAALQERAGGVVRLLERVEPGASEFLSRILARRLGAALAAAPPPLEELLSDEALAMLAHPIAQASNVRAALARLRDVLDFHREALPERLEAEHVVAVL